MTTCDCEATTFEKVWAWVWMGIFLVLLMILIIVPIWLYYRAAKRGPTKEKLDSSRLKKPASIYSLRFVPNPPLV